MVFLDGQVVDCLNYFIHINNHTDTKVFIVHVLLEKRMKNLQSTAINGNGRLHTNGNGHNGHILAPATLTPQKAVIEEAVRAILVNVGENPEREGLLKTPHRVAKMYDEVLSGYHQNLETLVNNALFDVDYQEMVVVKDIEYFSMCEHHMLPFFGRAHVAYIPRDKVIGLSKIPRIVEMFARRLQVQERMTNQIAEAIEEVLDPLGVAVVVQGSHMCSMMRGVKKEHPEMVTSTYRGLFREDKETKRELMEHLRRPSTKSIF